MTTLQQSYPMTLLRDFKKFLMQGNLVALAVAVVIGTVFAAVIKALIADIITPIIALIAGQPNFENLSFRSTRATFCTATSSTRCSPSSRLPPPFSSSS